MQRENMSRSTFVKGIAATCIAACSLGALSSGEYSTKSGDTYTASAAGIESDVSVTVTVDKSGTIKDVSVDVSGETPGVGADIGDEITQQILDAQSADIDGIAGATITSNAVKTALADALSQAGIDSGLESTTPAQGNAAETAGAESTTEAAESTTEAAAAEGTAETAAAAAGSYTPGTYTASAKGMDGDVPVTITIGDDGTITGVQVDVSGETAGIGAEIGDEVTKQILDAQSAEIDGVAGATVTSTAVKTAVADALAQASGAAALLLHRPKLLPLEAPPKLLLLHRPKLPPLKAPRRVLPKPKPLPPGLLLKPKRRPRLLRSTLMENSQEPAAMLPLRSPLKTENW